MAIRGILIDVYGTLVRENSGIMVDVCREMAELSPRPVKPGEVASALWQACQLRYTAWHGEHYVPYADLVHDAVAEVADQFDSRVDPLALAGQLLAAEQDPVPYDDGTLFCLSLPLPVVAVAHGDRQAVQMALSRSGLALKRLFCSEDAQAYKPSKAFFQAAVEALGFKPEEILFIGDSMAYDMIPAARAGMATAWVNRSRRAADAGMTPDLVVTDLMQIRRLIR